LAVCNLLAGTCDVLPSLKRGVFTVNCAIISGADCRSSNEHHQQSLLPPSYHSSFFKVLAIVADTYKNDYREYTTTSILTHPQILAGVSQQIALTGGSTSPTLLVYSGGTRLLYAVAWRTGS
jgi:hypothetical protein